MISSIGSAMSGISAAMGRFDGASQRLAQADPADPVRDRVEQLGASHAVESNASVIRTTDEMIGTLIDTVA